jgi:hypothetical protein
MNGDESYLEGLVDEAEAVMTAVIPDEEERQFVLRRLLDSADIAESIAPQAWGVTLFSNGFRLNVGQVEVLVFVNDWLRVNFSAKLGVLPFIGHCFKSARYRSMPEPKCAFVGTIHQYANIENVTRDAHNLFVRRAASTRSGKPRAGTPFRKSHHEGLIEFARRTLQFPDSEANKISSPLIQKREGMRRSVITVNISWNPYHWQKPYIDPRAGHSYTRKFPGHESVNFHFAKKGIDNETYVYGYSQWQHYPKDFSNGGYVLFYTKNLDTSESQIVGVYGDVEILNPSQKFHYEKFENNTLHCNMKASKALSLLFPLPLDAKKYSSGRMIGQIGFTYFTENIIQKVVSDEYELLKERGGFPDASFAVLNKLYNRLTGNLLSKNSGYGVDQNDIEEQNELEEFEAERDQSKIIEELKNVKPIDSEQIEVRGRIYKRDNKTIAQLKIVRGHKCQICSRSITKKDGTQYIEAAHITPKRQRGSELPNNIILLCPNHHKEFDLGKKEILKRDTEILVVKLNDNEYSIDLRIQPNSTTKC